MCQKEQYLCRKNVSHCNIIKPQPLSALPVAQSSCKMNTKTDLSWSIKILPIRIIVKIQEVI